MVVDLGEGAKFFLACDWKKARHRSLFSSAVVVGCCRFCQDFRVSSALQ